MQKETNDFARKLQNAIVSGDLKVVKRLIKGGIDVNSQTFSLNTWYETSVLHHAVLHNQAEIVQLLIQAKARVNAKNKDGRTALHLAARSGNTDIVQELIRAKADVDAMTNDNRTPLHVAAWRGNTEVVRQLVQAGSKVNIPDEGQWTPLYWAAKLNYREIAKILVQNGARMDCRIPKKNYTPLLEALSHGHVGMAKLLIHEGADIFHKPSRAIASLLFSDQHMHPQTATDMLDFCVQHGYDISKDHTLMQENYPNRYKQCQQFIDWIKNQRGSVCSLSESCRKTIRCTLIKYAEGRSIKDKIDTLQIPPLLRDYLKFEGEDLEMVIYRTTIAIG